MKGYQQYCAVAKALDIVGDRWVLLIVRELLAFGPSRYIDLERGLPGIASNLLVARLKSMQADGLIERRMAAPPIDAKVYELTQRGRDLDGVLRALANWGVPVMSEGPAEADAVQPQWSAVFAGLTLTPPEARPVVIGVETANTAVRAVLHGDGSFQVTRGSEGDVDVSLSGSALLIGGVLSGQLSPTEATTLGLVVTGRAELLEQLTAAQSPRTGVAS
jgi:DNA-binding HxlR family transcriptional regulator